MIAYPKPDQGLPSEFLKAAAERLNDVHGVASYFEFPGGLTFECSGRTWITGHTGLHVNDMEGFGDSLEFDWILVALENKSRLTLDEFVEAVLTVITMEETETPWKTKAFAPKVMSYIKGSTTGPSTAVYVGKKLADYFIEAAGLKYHDDDCTWRCQDTVVASTRPRALITALAIVATYS